MLLATRASPADESSPDGDGAEGLGYDSSERAQNDESLAAVANGEGATLVNGAAKGGIGVGKEKGPQDEAKKGNTRRGALVDKGGVSKDRLAFEELGTREVDRLFSTLEPCDVSGFKHKPGSLLDATALIGGTAVGAGILALPAATLQAGFLPSSVGLILM